MRLHFLSKSIIYLPEETIHNPLHTHKRGILWQNPKVLRILPEHKRKHGLLLGIMWRSSKHWPMQLSETFIYKGKQNEH
jgi:hypothetical protein